MKRISFTIGSSGVAVLPRTWRVALWAAIVPVAALVASLLMTWAITARPWSLQIEVGGTDSALLGPGFYTKERTAEGVAFRWTNGPATFRLPFLRSSAIVSLRADTATGQPYTVKLMEGPRRWASFEALPGFREYHVLWPSPVAWHGFGGLSGRDFTVLAEARPLRENDDRLYGIAINGFAARDLASSNLPIAPLLVVMLAVGSLYALIQPRTPVCSAAFAALALGLPALFGVLTWHPPTTNYTWLPLTWLPWFVALTLSGFAMARFAQHGRRAALLVAALVMLLFGALLWSLNTFWPVEGPDYWWHLNHGGSWERVFRAHRFYPFGFPLVLFLGERAGQPLLFGRATGALATLVLVGSSMALAWRLYGRAAGWLAGVALLGAPIVVAYGVLASTDAPMASATTLALLALCWHEQPRVRTVVLGGSALGLAYLFRFQAIVLLAPIVLWLLLQPVPVFSRRFQQLQRLKRFALPLMLVAAFVIVTAPQWLLDIRDFGRPFFTAQYVNIWTFGFNQQGGLPEGSAPQQLWYILNYDPSMLWRHWAGNLQQFATETLHNAFAWPFGMLAIIGLVAAQLALRDRRTLLLLLWATVYIAVVALTYNKERFYLPAMPVLASGIAGLVCVLGLRFAQPRARAVAYTVASTAMWCWALLHLLDAERELILYFVP